MKEEAVKVNIIFFINNIFNFIFLLYILLIKFLH